MTREEKIKYLAKAVMTLGGLGYSKTASVLNEIRLELKKQVKLPEGLEDEFFKYLNSADSRNNGNWCEEDLYELARYFAEWGKNNLK